MSGAPLPGPRPVVGDAAKAVLLRARGLARARSDEGVDSLHILSALSEVSAVDDLLARFEVNAEQIESRTFARRWASPPAEDGVEERTVDDARRVAAELGDREVQPAHLLIALATREGSGAAEVLASLGITADDLLGSIRFARGELDAWIPGQRPGRGDDQVLAEVDRWEEIGRKAGSPLRRVIGVGRAVSENEVTVELLAVEIREAVMLVHWRASAGTDDLLGMPDVAVHDGEGRAYECVGGSASGSMSGSGHEWRGSCLAMPSPPEAGTLTIEFRAFGQTDWAGYGPAEERRRDVAGSWRFIVDLDR